MTNGDVRDKVRERRLHALGLERVGVETTDWGVLVVLMVVLLACLAFWGLVVLGLIVVF